jgi:hypothetical protein
MAGTVSAWDDPTMRRRAVLLAAAVALGGCGSASRPPKPRESAGARVVRQWADAERAGRFDIASALFALPSKVANGGPVIRFRTRAEVDFFNRSLPCGAILKRTRPAAHGRFVATFELTERLGPGAGCGPGVGQSAEVAFRVRDGRIVEWLRVPDGSGGGQLT